MVDASQGDVVEQIMQLTDGRGMDVAIEALGTQKTLGGPARAAPRRHAEQAWACISAT